MNVMRGSTRTRKVGDASAKKAPMRDDGIGYRQVDKKIERYMLISELLRCFIILQASAKNEERSGMFS